MVMKRKRSSRFKPRRRRWTVTKRRISRRKWNKKALRTITSALEVKKRYFTAEANMSNDDNCLLYNPMQWLIQGANDAQVNGNVLFIERFMLKGTVSIYPDSTGYNACPQTLHIMMFKTADKIGTGSFLEGWTVSTTPQSYFSPTGTTISSSYFNSSRAQKLYHKKIKLHNPQLLAYDYQGATDTGVNGIAGSAYQYNFYCPINIKKRFQFQEATAGSIENGYGKYTNYYWCLMLESTFQIEQSQIRYKMTTLTTFKDI